MALDFPIRVRDLGEAERLRELDLPFAVRRRLPVFWWMQRNRRPIVVALVVFAVLAFSEAWTRGALVLEGPGSALYLRMALDHLGADRLVPYWLPELWAGSPIWAATPTLPTFLLLPMATALGPDVAVKVSVLAFQILGSIGAYVLARSLWRNFPASLVAGVLFGLQPLLLSSGVLDGSHPTLGVMAVAPWLAWSLRKGLRGDGGRYVALSGLFAGFAVLMQAEFAIGLAILGACLLAVEAGRVAIGRNPASPRQLLGRAAAVVAIALGCVAYWLLPFLSLSDSFVLSSPEMMSGDLLHGGRARVGGEIGMFFGRSGELSGAVGFSRQDLIPRFFHLGWACLALTLLSVALPRRRERDGSLAAILLAGLLGVWLSTGRVPLAASGPAQRAQWLAFVAAGLAIGLILGALGRPLRRGRMAPLLVVATVAFLVAVPYLTPFVTLQKVVPLLEFLRSPRLYTVAPLALALGAAYTVVLAQEWAQDHRARSAPAALPGVLAGAVALAVVGVVLVDIWPYRSYYRAQPPASAAAYRQVTAALERERGDFRVTGTEILPAPVDALLDTGRPLTIGWPQFVASRQVWRLGAEAVLAPNAYRDRAHALSATAHQAVERPVERGSPAESVPAVDLVRNATVLPMVRAYTHTVAMAGREVTPELAVGLAHRNVGVYTGSPAASPALAATTVVDVRSDAPCSGDSGAPLDPGLASQLGVACGLHGWLSTLVAGVDLLNIQEGVGALFRSTADRLQGISAYLDRTPDRAELALHEVTDGGGAGKALGRELARGKSVGIDEYGLAAFTFDPIAGSAGKEYAFVLTCPGCPAENVARLVAGHSVDRSGNLLVGGTLRRDRSAAFAPIHEPVAAHPPSTTTVAPTRRGPGRWRIVSDGPQPALVVVAEAYFPGWEARVDGRPAPVVEADGGFVGVPVDAGGHVVTLEYERPAAAMVGRFVTGATFLSLAALALRRRRRAGPRPAVSTGPARSPRPPRPPRGQRLPRPSRPEGPARPPVLPARERPRPEPPPPPPGDEPDWDDVVKPRDPPPDRHDGGPKRRPGTARWPPEPL